VEVVVPFAVAAGCSWVTLSSRLLYHGDEPLCIGIMLDGRTAHDEMGRMPELSEHVRACPSMSEHVRAFTSIYAHLRAFTRFYALLRAFTHF
jgi:hypothetical protein